MLIRLLSLLLGAVAFVVAAFFFSVLFLIGAAAALGLWGWLWWKTRGLRAQTAAAPPPGPDGQVIEGEYRVEEGHDAARVTDAASGNQPPSRE